MFFYSLFRKSNSPQNLLNFSRCDLHFCKYKMEIKTYLYCRKCQGQWSDRNWICQLCLRWSPLCTWVNFLKGPPEAAPVTLNWWDWLMPFLKIDLWSACKVLFKKENIFSQCNENIKAISYYLHMYFQQALVDSSPSIKWYQ